VPHSLARALHLPWSPTFFSALGERFMPHLQQAPWFGVLLFVALAATLFYSARKKLKQS
jgi:hypothetical protein